MPDEMATTTDKGRLERIASVGHVTVASLSGTVDDDMSGGGRAPRRHASASCMHESDSDCSHVTVTDNLNRPAARRSQAHRDSVERTGIASTSASDRAKCVTSAVRPRRGPAVPLE